MKDGSPIAKRLSPAVLGYGGINKPARTSTPRRVVRTFGRTSDSARDLINRPKTDAEIIMHLEIEASGWHLERLQLLERVKELESSSGRFEDVRELKNQCDSAVAQADAQKARVTSLEQRLTAKSDEVESLRAELAHTTQVYETRESELHQQLNTAIIAAENERNEAATNLDSFREKLEQLADSEAETREYARELAEQNAQLQDAIGELDRNKKQLESLLEDAQADGKRSKELMNESMREANQYREQLDEALSKLDDVQTKLEEATRADEHRTNEQEMYETRIRELSVEVEQLRNIARDSESRFVYEEAMRSNFQDKIRRLEDENSMHVANINSLQIALDGMKNKKLTEAMQNITALTNELGTTKEQLSIKSSQVSRLLSQLQELKGSIRVIARIRPAVSKSVGVRNTYSKVRTDPTERANGQEYEFDRVFGPQSTNDDVFAEMEYLVMGALRGGRACIFAYGQTGSGKTHTMNSASGVIAQTLDVVMGAIPESSEHRYRITGECVEIYNETIIDLLAPKEPRQLPRIASFTRNGQKGVSVKMNQSTGKLELTGARPVDIKTAEQGKQLIDHLSKQRHVAATALNAHSSRSHFVFILHINKYEIATGTVLSQGVLNLIDLAGSERVAKSKVTGDQFVEATKINQSLSSLGDVIHALQDDKKGHVPFRDSKLTHLLQDSLSGESKTLMLCNLAPETEHLNETVSTLRFADKVIKAKIQR